MIFQGRIVGGKKLRKQYELPDKDIIFVFAGRLTADKGVNELLSAFLSVEKKVFKCKIANAGWYG